VGESLVSMLDENGTPRPVERAKIAPPEGRLGAITPEERKAVLKSSPLAGRYEKAIDRESAYEILKARTASAAESSEKTVPAAKRSTRQSPVEAAITSAARSFGTQIGRQLLRGIFGSLSGGSRRRK
jgi:DNA helicase HerA-like ATPase